MVKWLKNHWDRFIFPSFFVVFIVCMIVEYYRGNCRIGKDMPICSVIEVKRTYQKKVRKNIALL